MNLRDLAWVIQYPKVMPRYSLGRVEGIRYLKFHDKTGYLFEKQIACSTGPKPDQTFLILKKEEDEP